MSDTGHLPLGADLELCSASEQAIKFSLGNAVALAGMADQAAAVDDRDVAAVVADKAGALQSAGRNRNAGTLHAQHHGQEFLREQKLVRLHAVVRHQQPATTSLLYGVKVIARGRLRDLVEEGMRIMKHH